MLLTEKVKLGGTDQFPCTAISPSVPKPSNDTRRCSRQLAADQSGSASQLVRDSVHADTPRVTVRLPAPSVSEQRAHAGDSDGRLGEPLPPGTPETVADDDCHLNAQALFQL